MATDETTDEPHLRCRRCRYETAVESKEWGRVLHPPLGTLTQCPECGSTNLFRSG